MTEPVTWLMPVKNGMPYLPLTLESIANQTYRDHSIIVWDNGSTDGTIEELRRWIPARIPGKIITDQPLSMGNSLAALVQSAQTELCARADADDIHSSTRLEKQVAHMLAHPKVVALGSQAVLIDSHGRPRRGSWSCPLHDAEVRWLTRWQSGLIHPAVLFRRSAVLRAGNYKDMKSEDCELWIRLCPFGEIYSLPDVLIHYRRHDASESGGYTDFFPGQLRAASSAAAYLFPPVPAEEALALWLATHPGKIQQPGPVDLRRLSQLSRAAKRLARQCGKSDDYFQNTPTFDHQAYWLRRKLLQRFGVSKLADRWRHLRARVRGTEPAAAP
jgi:glycosyltransferase involved in cell wall biosynthesis